KVLVKDPIAYHYEHAGCPRGGPSLKATMFLMNGLVQDFNFAARIEGDEPLFSCQVYLPMPPARTTLANFFSPLVNHAEQMFLTGKEPYPPERTLLTTGLVAAGVESLFQEGARLETPHLAVAYQAVPESTFWRS